MTQISGTSDFGDEPLSTGQLQSALAQSFSDIENERTGLARHLHDELGGFLVGALMDLTWVMRQGGDPKASSEKLSRAADLLRTAIELKRELIEQLKPTLLENIGLFSALRWHLKQQCEAAAVGYSESYPDEEVVLDAHKKVEIFRIIEDALRLELADGTLSALAVSVEAVDNALRFSLEGEHSSSHRGGRSSERDARASGMRFRALNLGGVVVLRTQQDRHCLELSLPLGD